MGSCHRRRVGLGVQLGKLPQENLKPRYSYKATSSHLHDTFLNKIESKTSCMHFRHIFRCCNNLLTRSTGSSIFVLSVGSCSKIMHFKLFLASIKLTIFAHYYRYFLIAFLLSTYIAKSRKKKEQKGKIETWQTACWTVWRLIIIAFLMADGQSHSVSANQS